jgi:uncharacterized protein involved in cysteine biosynthesis
LWAIKKPKPSVDGHRRRGERSFSEMELVLTILVVVLLVVLPIAFFLLVIGGLLYSVYRAIMGDKVEVERSTPGIRRAS